MLEPGSDDLVFKSGQSKTSKDTAAFDNPLYDASTGAVHLIGYERMEEPAKQQLEEEKDEAKEDAKEEEKEEDTKSTSSGKKAVRPDNLKPILDNPEWETF